MVHTFRMADFCYAKHGSSADKTHIVQVTVCLLSMLGMKSLSIQTAIQKNEAKLSSFVQFENEMASYTCTKLCHNMHCSLIMHSLQN